MSTLSLFGRASALGTVGAGSSRLRRRCCPAGLAGHVGFGAEQAGEQAANRQVGIECFPMQPKTVSKNFDRRELVLRCALQALGEVGRESEAAAVCELDNDAAAISASCGDGDFGSRPP